MIRRAAPLCSPSRSVLLIGFFDLGLISLRLFFGLFFLGGLLLCLLLGDMERVLKHFKSQPGYKTTKKETKAKLRC